MSDHEETDLVQQLLALQRERAHGALEIGTGTGMARVLLDAGRPCAVVGGVPTDTLGRLLVAEGVIGTADYAAILARLIQAAASGKPLRFGDVAVEFRFLTAEQLREALSAQVKHKVLRCLRRGRAVSHFEQGAKLPDEASRFPTDVEPLLVALASSFDDAKLGELLHLRDGKCPRLTGEAADVARAFQLRPDEGAFLARLDGSTDTRELLEEGAVEAGPLLAALMLAGKLVLEAPVVEFDPEASTRRLSRPGATRRRLSSLPSARSGMKSVGDRDTPPAARLEAEAALRKLTEPGRVGTQGTFSGAPKSQNEARLLAEASFQLGLGYLRGGAMARAVVELRRAASLLPGASEYLLYARWAEYSHTQGALGEADRASRLSAVEVAVDAAFRDEPDLAYAHFVFGQLRLLELNDDAALEAFEKAARLDPELLEAQREIRLLELKKRRSSPSYSDLSVRQSNPTVVDPVELVEEVPLPAAPPPPPKASPPTAPPRKPSPVPPSPPPSPVVAPAPEVAAAPVMTAVPEAPTHAAVEPAPAPVVAMPSPPAPVVAVPMEKAAPAKPAGLPLGVVVVLLLALLGGGGAAIWYLRGMRGAAAISTPTPTATPTASASATSTSTSTSTATPTETETETATSTASASAGPTLAPSASASASPTVIPSATPSATPSTSASGATDELFGEVTTGASASGHRVIVDGHSVGNAPGPFRVRCGSHTVQLGSAGTPQRVSVPCGGTLTLK